MIGTVKMKRILAALLAVGMLVANLSACNGRRSSVLYTGRSELYSVACVSVPFVRERVDRDVVEELERDSYGRIMFKCKSGSLTLSDYCGDEMQALVICQKYDDEYSYYYANYNFMYIKNGDIDSGVNIARLKFLNDWDKPLDESKMSKVKKTLYPFQEYNKYYEENMIKQISDYLIKINAVSAPDVEYGFDICSSYEDEMGLFVIREYALEENKFKFYNAYFAVYDENYNLLMIDGEPCILQINDMVNCQDDLKAIKEMCGWNKPQ